jgi:hypothetical protein
MHRKRFPMLTSADDSHPRSALDRRKRQRRIAWTASPG